MNFIFPQIIKSVKGKTVLDPFGGAGCIIYEALRRGARGIYIDINPYAYLIARVTLEWFNNEELRNISKRILSRKRLAYKGSNGLLKFISRETLYTVTIRGIKKRVRYYEWNGNTCWAITVDGERIEASDFTEGEPYHFVPKYMLWYPWREPFYKRRNYNWLHEFFTNRNLIILTNIWHDIRRPKSILRDTREHRALVLAFLSTLYMSSKMARRGAGSWGINSYWVPKSHVEYNPYELLERKINRLLSMKPPLNREIRITGSISCIREVLKGRYDAALIHGDSRRVLGRIPQKSIDLVITDPPHADEIQYFELSFFMNAWIEENPYSWALNEIVVNPKQYKDFNKYLEMLVNTYKLLYEVLKPDGKMIVIHHEEDSWRLRNMVKAIEEAGFTIDKEFFINMKQQRNIGDRDITKGRELQIVVCVR